MNKQKKVSNAKKLLKYVIESKIGDGWLYEFSLLLEKQDEARMRDLMELFYNACSNESLVKKYTECD